MWASIDGSNTNGTTVVVMEVKSTIGPAQVIINVLPAVAFAEDWCAWLSGALESLLNAASHIHIILHHTYDAKLACEAIRT